MDPNAKRYNSTVRSKSLKRQEAERLGLHPKKPRVLKPKLKEVMKRFNVVTAKMLGEPKKRKPIKKRSANNTGWYNWAVEKVWKVRPHRCEVCNAPLGDEERPAPIVFSHLLPRKTYRRYKCDERNVVLKCPYCHNMWHERGPTMLAMENGWRNTCNLYFMLRDEANGITK